MVTKDGEYTIRVSVAKVYDFEKKPELLNLFLNISLRGIMSRQGYIQIGKSSKYFNANSEIKIEGMKMLKGYQTSFLEVECGHVLRVDNARKIIRSDTVLNFIDALYKKLDKA